MGTRFWGDAGGAGVSVGLDELEGFFCNPVILCRADFTSSVEKNDTSSTNKQTKKKLEMNKHFWRAG